MRNHWTRLMLMVVLVTGLQAQTLKLDQLFETNPVFTTAESVNYDAKRNVLYISCINGKPTEKDGNGFIARIKPRGQVLNTRWVSGLNAPKGAAVAGDRLFVADIDVLVEIDIPSAAIVKRHPAPGATFLNDVAVDAAGNLYVSDSASTTIYRFDGKGITVWLQDKRVKNPNGLLTNGNDLLVGSSRNGKIFAVSFKDRSIREIGKADYGIDGLKRGPRGMLIVSDWRGHVGMVRPDGSYTLLFDTSKDKINAADIEVIPDWKMLYVPTFFHNTVVGYRIRVTD